MHLYVFKYVTRERERERSEHKGKTLRGKGKMCSELKAAVLLQESSQS